MSDQEIKPPYDGSDCEIDPRGVEEGHTCPWGTLGCALHHDGSDPIPEAVLEQRRKRYEALKQGKHWTGD